MYNISPKDKIYFTMSTKPSATENLSLAVEINLFITNRTQRELYNWISIYLHNLHTG